MLICFFLFSFLLFPSSRREKIATQGVLLSTALNFRRRDGRPRVRSTRLSENGPRRYRDPVSPEDPSLIKRFVLRCLIILYVCDPYDLPK